MGSGLGETLARSTLDRKLLFKCDATAPDQLAVYFNPRLKKLPEAGQRLAPTGSSEPASANDRFVSISDRLTDGRVGA